MKRIVFLATSIIFVTLTLAKLGHLHGMSFSNKNQISSYIEGLHTNQPSKPKINYDVFNTETADSADESNNSENSNEELDDDELIPPTFYLKISNKEIAAHIPQTDHYYPPYIFLLSPPPKDIF